MEKPLVSVIIPTYNRANFLKLTIESVVSQTYQNIEVFVIDDGSPTNDAEIVCSEFSKVNYLRIENSGGPARPRNVGIQNAKGKYLAFVDDDDLWLPNKIEKQVAILEDNPDFGLVHGCCEIVDEKGELQNRIIGRLRNPLKKHGDVSLTMIGNWTVMMPTSFVRKEVVDSVGFFNENMPSAGEDTEFWTRCSFETRFYYYDEPLVYYRVHNDNISKDYAKYFELPLYLKKVLDATLQSEKISTHDYKLLKKRLGLMYLKNLKLNKVEVLRTMKIFDLYWFLDKDYFIKIIRSI